MLAVGQLGATPIEISVDATSVTRNILRTRETLPVAPGSLTLVFPKWIPGNHGPTGPIGQMIDLHFTVDGEEIPWRRDDVDMFAFHLTIPEGKTHLNVAFDDVASTGAFSSPESAYISFNQLLLYPAGMKSDDVAFRARVTFPEGWGFATALHGPKPKDNVADFETVSLTRLVDSPILCGVHFRKQILATGDGPVHEIDMAGDDEDCVQMPPKTAAQYATLVAEARALFGATHYREYHWLVPVSDTLRGRGLEHHECSEDGARRNVFQGDEGRVGLAGLLAHEYVHSWCGKYRRPIGLATPNYQEPMKGELLYVYEGLTQYLGTILPPRAGLWTKDELLSNIAATAATLDHRPGRLWRSLQDTAVSSQFVRTGDEWSPERRQQDYYQEAVLIWLEADTVIRQDSGGKRSLDDFCQAFFGPPSTEPKIVPYNFDELVAGLNSVQPYDWRGFLRQRLDSHGPHAPLGGIANSGWRLVYEDKPAAGARRAEPDTTLTLGCGIGTDGSITSVVFDTPADKAGLVAGNKLVAVNGKVYSDAALRAAVKSHKSLDLLVAVGDNIRPFHVDYSGGELYPRLVRDESKPDLLSAIIKPRSSK